MNTEAQQHAHQTGHHTGGNELKGVGHRQCLLTLPQDAQQGARIKVLACKGSGCQSHRHRTQKGSKQRNQIQKLFRTV